MLNFGNYSEIHFLKILLNIVDCLFQMFTKIYISGELGRVQHVRRPADREPEASFGRGPWRCQLKNE